MREKIWDPGRVTDRLRMEAIRRRRPLSCLMELTCACNFRCRMCYVRMDPEEAAKHGRIRTAAEWIGMAAQLRDAGVLFLTLTGGECTRHPEFPALYEEIAKMGFRLGIMSNAGGYTDEIRDLFARFPPANATVSLYGGCDETYAAMTGDPRGFSKTMANVRFLRSLGVPVSLNFTMIRQNALDYPKVARACAALGLPYTLLTDITPHRHGAGLSEAESCRLGPAERACLACRPPEEAAQALEEAGALEKELEGFRMPEGDGAPPDPDTNACVGSFSGCAIFWNGLMQTCVSLYGYRCVRPFDTGFEAAWAELQAARETTFRRPAACRVCEMAADCPHNCHGRRFEGTGSPLEPDPDVCRYVWLLRRRRAWRNAAEAPPAPGCG